MSDRLKHIDEAAFGRIVGEILDKTVFRHDSAVKRGIDEFREYLGDLHFDDEKKAGMFASFMAQVIEATVTPTVQMAAQLAETDAKMVRDEELQRAQIEKVKADTALTLKQQESVVYENTYILPLKKGLLEVQKRKESAEADRIAADRERIEADKLRIEAQTASIRDQTAADVAVKNADKDLKEAQKAVQTKQTETDGVIDLQKQLLASQAAAFDANKYLKGADSIGQVMGMLVTNDVSPSAGMVGAHRAMLESATGVSISDYTSVK